MTSDNKTDGFVDNITNLARVTQAVLDAMNEIEARLTSIDARLATIEKSSKSAMAAKSARSTR